MRKKNSRNSSNGISHVWKRISANPLILGFLAGLSAVLAFPPIEITSLLLLTPFFLFLAVEQSRTPREAFLAGFMSSLAVMLGAFYWVVYVLHTFGHMPWVVAGLIYLLFCGFGALNLPLFSWCLFQLHRRFPSLRRNAWWWVLGAPAVFVVIEFLVPKLFPWYVGHGLYKALWINQIVELTGSEYLTLMVFAWGGLGVLVYLKSAPKSAVRSAFSVPMALTLIAIGFSVPAQKGGTPTQKKRVALIQANIGSLEKLKARQGIRGKVQYTVERYLELTEKALQGPKPDLILWPETAMPFSLGSDMGYATPVRRSVLRWNTPLISGGYAPSARSAFRDSNAAFLLEPRPDGALTTSIYRKNILLAFGEYFPGGETFPTLYQWFPAVSNFERGSDQEIFTLQDGTRLGITICYEAIVPPFYRKVANQGVHAVVNLTNDSWFGPTSEPYQHAALAVFRAIESRTPLLRVTNTGISFTVDRHGKMSQTTPVYDEGVLNVEVDIPTQPTQTFYLRWGDWLIVLLLGIALAFLIRARNVSKSL